MSPFNAKNLSPYHINISEAPQQVRQWQQGAGSAAGGVVRTPQVVHPRAVLVSPTWSRLWLFGASTGGPPTTVSLRLPRYRPTAIYILMLCMHYLPRVPGDDGLRIGKSDESGCHPLISGDSEETYFSFSCCPHAGGQATYGRYK